MAVLETRRLGKPSVPVHQILFLGSVWIVDNDKPQAVPPNSRPAGLVPAAKIYLESKIGIKANGVRLALRSIAGNVPNFKAVLLASLAVPNFLFELEDSEDENKIIAVSWINKRQNLAISREK